jgi:hypothetical protein
MQKEGGGFRNRFIVGQSSQSDRESPYSNGEALLALTRLALYEPDAKAKQALESAVTYLMTLPYDTALYLWIMAAIKDIALIDYSLVDKDYVQDFTQTRINNGIRTRSLQRNFCAYTEGIVSALSILKNELPNTTYAPILNEAEIGLRLNRNLQLTTVDSLRAFISDRKLELSATPLFERAVGGFLTGERKEERVERIDFTQHCVSAHLQMLTDVRQSSLIQ